MVKKSVRVSLRDGKLLKVPEFESSLSRMHDTLLRVSDQCTENVQYKSETVVSDDLERQPQTWTTIMKDDAPHAVGACCG